MNSYPSAQPTKKPLALAGDGRIKGLNHEISQKFHPTLRVYSESMIQRRLLPGTRDLYLKAFKKFLSHHPQSNVNTLSRKVLLNYFKSQSVKMSPSLLRQNMAAIKFFYRHTLGREKMSFAVTKERSPSLFTLYLPFYDLRDLIDPIESPGDKLLLYLVYHANIRLSDICRLPKDAYDLFQNPLRMDGDEDPSIQYFKGLVCECKEQYHQNTYLVENNGQAHNLVTLKRKLFRILGRYGLEDIYQLQYEQLLQWFDFSDRTRAMYLKVFMKFLKHFNFKHPTFICDEEIRDYLTLLRQKSPWHQKVVLGSLKFFFEKIHKRHLSIKHLVNPHQGAHLSSSFFQPEMVVMPSTANRNRNKPSNTSNYGLPWHVSHPAPHTNRSHSPP